jgi:hypothetical protein
LAKNESVSSIGDNDCMVQGIGNIEVFIKIGNDWIQNMLEDVLYVPGLGENLFQWPGLPR